MSDYGTTAHGAKRMLILDKSPNLASPNTAPDIHCCTGPGKAGSSIEVPSGSTMKSGGGPEGGARGAFSNKHTNLTSRHETLVLPRQNNTPPAPGRLVTPASTTRCVAPVPGA